MIFIKNDSSLNSMDILDEGEDLQIFTLIIID